MNTLDLGQQLKAARKEKKMTLKELAELSGIHFVTLSRFENGLSDLGVRKIIRLAKTLGLEVTLHRLQQGYTLDDLATGALKTTEGKALLQKTKRIRK